MYDIQVEETECFFANGVLVHNCVIIDDPVRSQEDADSEKIRNTTWDWYVTDILTRLKPGGVQVLIQTRWHEDDLAGRILEREASSWKVIKIPMIAGENDPLKRKPGERRWKEWFTDEMVERAQQDPRSWSALYQQEPRPTGGGEFKRGWINYYETRPDPRNLGIVMLVDPASEKAKKRDFTAIWVLGIGGDDNVYVLDIVRDRLNLTERAEEVFRLHRKWRPQEVRYEKYGMMADVEHIKYEMDRQSYRFRIREVGGSTKKEDRIRRLIPYFEEGRMWFPHQHLYTDRKGATIDLVQHFTEAEYLAFPVSRWDDLMDSLSRLAEPGLLLPRPRRTETPLSSGVTGFQTFDAEMGW